MKTENEIKALPLEERQKLVQELKQIGTGDKAYANAKAIIELITGMKDWKEPKVIEVKNIAGHDVSVDGATIAKDATGKVFPWQASALARFLEPVAKAAAMLLFALLIGLGLSANATTTQAFGSPGSFNGLYVAGLTGGTNSIPTNTVTTYMAATYTTNTINQITWTNVNGIQTPSTNTVTTSIVTNVPGLFALPANQPFTLTYGAALFGAAGQSVAKLAYSPDGNSWQSNYWTMPLTANSSAEVITTNIQVPALSGGWGRLDSVSGLVTSGGTNIYFEVSKPQ